MWRQPLRSSRKRAARVVSIGTGVGAALFASAARAGVSGFGNFSGFTINQNDTGSSPSIPTAGTIELTNAGNEDRSIFSNAPQDVTQFTASFTFLATNVSGFNGGLPGAMFVIENDPRGASAIGSTVDNYGFQGIAKSFGISFDLVANTTGLFTNGTIGSGAASVSPVNLASGDPINIQLTYSGSTLTETLVDTVTAASFTTTDLVLTSIPTTVGGSTAYVGVTAGSSSRALAGANEYFSNFQVSGVPEPSLAGLAAAAGAALVDCRSSFDACERVRLVRPARRLGCASHANTRWS